MSDRDMDEFRKPSEHLDPQKRIAELEFQLGWQLGMLMRARTFIVSAYEEGVSGVGDRWIEDFDRGTPKFPPAVGLSKWRDPVHDE